MCVQQGNYELTKALEYCPKAQILRGTVTDFFADGGKINGLRIEGDNDETHDVSTPNVVFATGPLFEETMGLLKKRDMSSFNIPIINELHARAVFDDPSGTITPTMPLTFDTDPIGHLEVRVGWMQSMCFICADLLNVLLVAMRSFRMKKDKSTLEVHRQPEC